MEKKKSLGFGFRGWILIIVLFLGFAMFQVFTMFPVNILADLYGGAQAVAGLMTIGTLIGIILQIIISTFVGKIKSIKTVTAVVGAVAVLLTYAVSCISIASRGLWSACYLLLNVVVTMYALFFLSIIAGQWFPRRKGTVMGIATIAYPFCNGVIGLFASSALGAIFPALGQTIGEGLGAAAAAGDGAAMGVLGPIMELVEQGDMNGALSAFVASDIFPTATEFHATVGAGVFSAFLPFLIATTIGYILFLVFVTDYPEQCGAYRDNDKDMTPEIAQKMMMAEIEAKRTTVWKLGNIFSCRDFWFAAVTCGLLLICAVGTMTQSQAIISSFPELDYTVIMMIVAIFGAIGSWLLGVLDTKFGTKKSMIIATFLMVVAGILGVIARSTGVGAFMVVAMVLVAMFMGASSNYTVSVAAQYWRREDFAPVFACVNPVANIFNALAATVVAALLYQFGGVSSVFIFIAVCGVIGIILMLLFSPAHVKEVDDKYRKAAGKPLDDALVGRK